MLKLLKYELRKTMGFKLFLLALTAVAQAAFLIGLYMERDSLFGTGMLALTLLALCGTIIAGIQSILTLHRDMNTRQGYMLFMTPHSCFSILGAKAIECTVSILLTGLLFTVLGALDIALVLAKFGELQSFIQMATDVLRMFNMEISMNPDLIYALIFGMLCSWVSVVMVAFLADVVASALLRGKKFSGLASLVLFLVLYWLVGKIVEPFGTTIGIQQMLTIGAIELGVAAVMYAGAAMIMERRLSV